MKKLAVIMFCLSVILSAKSFAAGISDLEDLSLSANAYWNGSELKGSYSATDSFATGTASLNNFYAYDANFMFSSWGGFGYSNITDTTTTGLAGQYNAITGSGQGGSDNYAVGYCNTFAAGQPAITFETAQTVSGAYFTNTNYAYDSMLNGDAFAKKFEAGDWFKLTITGKDASGAETGTIDFLLADGTAIVNTWTWVDLSGLGSEVKTLEFSLSSSDSSAWGMNTPAYFAMDILNGTGDFENLTLDDETSWNGSDLAGSYTATDEFTSGIATFNNYYAYDKGWDYHSWSGFAYTNSTDTTTTGLAAQYMAIAEGGAKGSENYAIAYCNAYAPTQPEITFDEVQTVSGAYFANTNYAYYSMLNGDGFAKKFEAGDWFKLTITGKDASGAETGSIDFLLADGVEIVDIWTWVDLSSLGEIKTIAFSLTSSDSDPVFGMNTPAYFAIDSINDPEQENENPDQDDNNDPLGCFIGVSGMGMQF